MRSHVQRTTARCFTSFAFYDGPFHWPFYQSVLAAHVLLRLDYGNETWLIYRSANIIISSPCWAVDRSIASLRRDDHITYVLINLNWLHVPERFEFKPVTLRYRSFARHDPYILVGRPSSSRLRSTGQMCDTRARLRGDCPRSCVMRPEFVTVSTYKTNKTNITKTSAPFVRRDRSQTQAACSVQKHSSRSL